MENILNITVAEIIHYASDVKSFGDDMAILELYGSGDRRMNITPATLMRIDGISILLICNGSIDITVDDRSYNLRGGALLDLFDMHLFGNISVSDDFRGYHVLLSKSFLMETMRDTRRLPIGNFLARRANPVQQISEHQRELLEHSICRIVESISREEHVWYRDLVKNALRGLFLEVGGIVFARPIEDTASMRSNRRDSTIERFVQLLDLHCRVEHSVSFYADQLCMDAPYLSRLLKSTSGRTAGRWIDDTIMREAKIRLRDPSVTIQGVADELNFSDQSAFGKFFKKNSGLTPLQYRRQSS